MKNYLLLFTLFYTLAGLAQGSTRHLKVQSATAKKWAGGIAGRSGVNYTFQLQGLSKYKISFDSIWIMNEGAFSLKPENTYEGLELNILSRYDSTKAAHTITAKRLRIQSLYPTPEELAVLQRKPDANPFKVKKAVAIISYVCGGKKYYLPVRSITQLEKVNHP